MSPVPGPAQSVIAQSSTTTYAASRQSMMQIIYSKANIAQNLICELWKRQSVCHAVTRHVETASLWLTKGSGICDTVTQWHDCHQGCLRTDTKLPLWPEALGQPVAHLPLRVAHRSVSVCVGRKNCTGLDLMEKLISRQGAGCTHPVNTVTSTNWPVCFTAPIYSFNIALLSVHQPSLEMGLPVWCSSMAMPENISIATTWEKVLWYKGIL